MLCAHMLIVLGAVDVMLIIWRGGGRQNQGSLRSNTILEALQRSETARKTMVHGRIMQQNARDSLRDLALSLPASCTSTRRTVKVDHGPILLRHELLSDAPDSLYTALLKS